MSANVLIAMRKAMADKLKAEEAHRALPGADLRLREQVKEHIAAWNSPKASSLEFPLTGLLTHLCHYADSHRDQFEADIANDGVMGEGWWEIWCAIHDKFMIGDLGRFDGGTIDAMLRAMALAAGYRDRMEEEARL